MVAGNGPNTSLCLPDMVLVTKHKLLVMVLVAKQKLLDMMLVAKQKLLDMMLVAKQELLDMMLVAKQKLLDMMLAIMLAALLCQKVGNKKFTKCGASQAASQVFPKCFSLC